MTAPRRIVPEKLDPYRCSVEELEEALALVRSLPGSEDSDLLFMLESARQARGDGATPPFVTNQVVRVKKGLRSISVEYRHWFREASLDIDSGERIVTQVLYSPEPVVGKPSDKKWWLVLICHRRPCLFPAKVFELAR